MASHPRQPADLGRSLMKRQAQSMNRTLTFAMALFLAFAVLASLPSRVSVGSPSSPASPSKGVLIRLATDSLRISIDDENKPFLLKNLNERFASASLIEFLRDFVAYCSKNNEAPHIVVESVTKRIVNGEDAFNDCLKQMAAEHGVVVVILPGPTGHDPDTELRRFFDDIKPPQKRQRTKP